LTIGLGTKFCYKIKRLQNVVAKLKIQCKLPSMHDGAIDGTHISISKPFGPFPQDSKVQARYKVGQFFWVAEMLLT
jgi:hypothetical protein